MPPSPDPKRACDRCRKRKIKVKCDSARPCSYCRISSRTCSYDLPFGKRGPKGPRAPRPSTAQSDPLGTAVPEHLLPRHDVDSESAGDPHASNILEKLRCELCCSIREKVPGVPINRVVHDCISIFFRRSFPNNPILHEPTMRADATMFFGPPNEEATAVGSAVHGLNKDGLSLMRSFAVLTAMCATMAFLHAKSDVVYGAAAGPIFLDAARSMLREYEFDDLRDPDSSSLQLRVLLSTCFQTYLGESGLAWHLVGEAGLIVRRLRLYSETVLGRYPALEATLLRNLFWALYTADCAAIAMQNRAAVLYEPLFDAEMDTATVGLGQVPLLATGDAESPGEFELSILRGWHQFPRILSSTAHLLTAIRKCGNPVSNETQPEVADNLIQLHQISKMYSEFTAILDAVPSTLHPSYVVTGVDQGLTDQQRSCYVSQRYRLLSVFYCAKLMIIHECSRRHLTAAVGLRDDNVSLLLMEEINIARDFIHNLQSIPFHYLLENGEPGVEFMRVVGTILLEISQRSDNVMSSNRARAQLGDLLDIVSRLDSRASTNLTARLLQKRQNEQTNI